MMIVAVGLGAGATYLMVEKGQRISAIALGPWFAWPNLGTPDGDPYSAARQARTGQLPLGASEGIAFFAETDSQGAPLDGTCIYVLDGQTPPARLWTLAAYEADGGLKNHEADKYSLDSREIVRRTDGSFEITISGKARPGNWLPLGGRSSLMLVLRLYDTPLTTGAGQGNYSMPKITRGECP